MGGLFTKGSSVDKSPSESTLNTNGVHRDYGEAKEKWMPQLPLSFSDRMMPANSNAAEEEPQSLSRSLLVKSKSTRSMPSASSKAGTTKVSEVSSLLGRAGTAGLGKAVEVLETLGSSMTGLHLSGGFVSGVTTKENKISILAFDVANTIVKGANLMHSLSQENIKHLKEVVLPSEGVQHLISKDMDELLRMAAADKRWIKEGRMENILWRSRSFRKSLYRSPVAQLRSIFLQIWVRTHTSEQVERRSGDSDAATDEMVQYTAELYHELNALTRFEHDYWRKLQEEDASTAVQRGCKIMTRMLKKTMKEVKEGRNATIPNYKPATSDVGGADPKTVRKKTKPKRVKSSKILNVTDDCNLRTTSCSDMSLLSYVGPVNIGAPSTTLASVPDTEYITENGNLSDYSLAPVTISISPKKSKPKKKS